SSAYDNYRLDSSVSESDIPTPDVEITRKSSLGGSTFKYPPASTPYSNPYNNYQLGTNVSKSEDKLTSKDSHQFNSQIPTAHIEPEILEQMRELLAVGNHIGIEYVDKRRFRTGSWKSFSHHQIDNVADAIATLEACLGEHNQDYVRLIGIDPKAKRRIMETIIQRPGI
ncbi:MAG: ribulose bisphosphate carboxylase small subunit, partial [Cyanobacteria bacterium P01_A01_bin.84]